MLEREEQKKPISYVDLENTITSTKKFGLMHFELHNPTHRSTILELLYSSLKLHNVNAKEMVLTKQLINYLKELMVALDKNEISLPDTYTQIYNKILTTDNLRTINEEANICFSKRKITLLERYLLNDTLQNLAKCQEKIKENSGIEEKAEVKSMSLAEKMLYVETVQQFAEKAKINDYLIQSLNAGFIEKMPEWQGYNEVCNKLAEGVSMIRERNALIRLKKDREMALPKNEWRDLSISYANMDKSDFKSLIEFVNENYAKLPETAAKQTSELLLIDKINQFGNQQNDLHMTLQATGSNLAEDKIGYTYPSIAIEVIQFLNHFKENNVDPERLSNLWAYIYSLVAENQASKNLYLLAFINKIIYDLYQNDTRVDHGVLWLTNRITNMLDEVNMNSQAQKYLVKVAIAILLDITGHDKNFGDVELFVKKVSAFQNRHPFPAALHEQLDKDFKDAIYREENSLKYSGNEAKRAEILEDLNRKEVQYVVALEKMITPLTGYYSDRDKRMTEILIARLGGQEYQRERIRSGDALSAKNTRDELLNLFKERVFTTRTFRASHSSKITAKMDLSKVSIANISLFKQEPQEIKNNEIKPISTMKQSV